MRPYKPRSRVAAGVARKTTLTSKSHKFAALSPVKMTAAGEWKKNCTGGYKQTNKNKTSMIR
jgi:hypothetical protein